MLRFLIATSLRLLIVCAGIGLLICKQWGWPEYASDELYLVAVEGGIGESSFVLVNTDGSGQEWALSASTGRLIGLNCSPDGRTLAFVTDSPRLYVVNRSGVEFERAVDRVFTDRPNWFYVANNGIVAYFFDLIGSASESRRLTSPEQRPASSLAISSSGLLLWERPPNEIVVTSAEKDILWALGSSVYSSWLAPENIFAFTYPYPSNYGMHQYLADIKSQNVVALPSESPTSIISPDVTKRVISIFGYGSDSTHILLTSIFSDDPIRELSFKNDPPPIPLCFLTFRPQMLLADTP